MALVMALAFFAYHVWSELAVVRGAQPNFLQRLELLALDLKFSVRGAVPPDEWRVAVAAVDERSLKRIGRWPWSRAVLARLVDRLTELGAAAVAFDVTFDAASSDAPAAVVESIRTSAAAAGLYESRAEMVDSASVVREAAAVSSVARDRDVSALSDELVLAADRMDAAAGAIDAFRGRLSAASADNNPDREFAAALRRSGKVVLGVVAYSKLEADSLPPEDLERSLAAVSSATISEIWPPTIVA